MKDLNKKLWEGLQKTGEFLKASSEEAVNKLKEGGEMLSNAIPKAKEKGVEMVNDTLAVLPLLEEAGYRTNEFRIGMSITPVLEVSFSKFKEVEETQIDQLKSDYAEKTMFMLMLNSLETAQNFALKLDSEAYHFHETVLEISFPPKVSLRYIHKENLSKVSTASDHNNS